MQSISRLGLRRCYSTATPPLPTREGARTASTPRAVRLRRRQQGKGKPLLPALAHGRSDATPTGLTPTDHARYQRLKAVSHVAKEDEWLEKRNKARTRIRGIRTGRVKETGKLQTEVDGEKVYLPNIIFRLVRNNTPKGEPYNPYEATFRIPQSVTKTDVRSYLSAIYGVQTTYIRTDNYLSPVTRSPATGEGGHTKAYKTYKRAVVGLVDPFYYPLALEHMEDAERADREKWIETNFAIESTKQLQKYELLRLTKSGSKDWKWRGSLTHKRGTILKLVAEKRAAREGLVQHYLEGVKNEREAARIMSP